MPLTILNRRFFNGGGIVSASAGAAIVGGSSPTSLGRVSPRPAAGGVAPASFTASPSHTGGAGAQLASVGISAYAPSVTTGGGTVSHGEDITLSNVGPWALQGVAKGSESLQTVSGPGRGYFKWDTPSEFAPTTAWPSNANDSNPSILNASSLKGGVVTGSPVTIDGYSIPVGTQIVQFKDFPDGYDFYVNGQGGGILLRGCRIRFSSGVGGTGVFNDNGALSSYRLYMHYCDMGLQSLNPPDGTEGLMHVKNLGGSNHRFLRNYLSRSQTFLQPNVNGVSMIENYITEFIFVYGEGGTTGSGGSSIVHMNGISSEGGRTSMYVLRNKIICQSPDGSNGTPNSAIGHVGYGTQVGQTGYGSGSNPGRLTTQTDCIALFTTNGSANQGDLQVKDNYLAGTGYCIYAGNGGVGNLQGMVMTGNKISTLYWTNGGANGAIVDQPTWGSNGNVQSNNTWADDYGTGGNGCTLASGRQYPSGNGPRAGTSFI